MDLVQKDLLVASHDCLILTLSTDYSTEVPVSDIVIITKHKIVLADILVTVGVHTFQQ